MTDELERKVDQLAIDVAEIRTALKGFSGNQGLIPAFTKHCANDDKFRADYYSFKRKVLAVFFFLLGSGALGIGGVKVVEFLAKGG